MSAYSAAKFDEDGDVEVHALRSAAEKKKLTALLWSCVECLAKELTSEVKPEFIKLLTALMAIADAQEEKVMKVMTDMDVEIMIDQFEGLNKLIPKTMALITTGDAGIKPNNLDIEGMKDDDMLDPMTVTLLVWILYEMTKVRAHNLSLIHI